MHDEEGTAEAGRFGLLHQWSAPLWMKLVAALLLLDAWMYVWHRGNHAIPFLWRFHRMHHSDPEVDATTALRFHVGEIAISSLLRLAVIPLLGVTFWQVLPHETLLLPVIAFHYSNVALPEGWDRRLRGVIVSPNVHRIHHSDWQPKTDSDFASVFPGGSVPGGPSAPARSWPCSVLACPSSPARSGRAWAECCRRRLRSTMRERTEAPRHATARRRQSRLPG